MWQGMKRGVSQKLAVDAQPARSKSPSEGRAKAKKKFK
jgi:hypothetical protein